MCSNDLDQIWKFFLFQYPVSAILFYISQYPPEWHAAVVVSTVILQQLGPMINLLVNQGCLSVWSLHVLPVAAWVSSEFKGMQTKSPGYSELPIGVKVSVALQWIGALSRVFSTLPTNLPGCGFSFDLQ